MSGGWRPLNSFSVGTGHQEVGTSSTTLLTTGEEREAGVELIPNAQ